ncbi:hypothetical protein NDN11_04870 [Acinetobacter sp. C26M]|uniref:hypothetical protein n=1 Tax=unclassified Acinetobacter TaxID=196816 RepID=UPI0020367DEC|nr:MULTISPECIES: hypothetical protein [unclassified Acinetobacter]USA47450.1 hypothetical protein NDN11_04870 [Acinetobacter sp. C26M]USA50931.1 hypothetical protein NDN12_04870 [Acinetobacter sp. C26G]
MQKNYTEEDLRLLSVQDLLDLFHTLNSPSIEEMNGEYAAYLLSQPNWLADKIGHITLNNFFRQWLSKAFRPLNSTTGQGYNTFQQGHRIVQCYPMMTMIAPSRFDNQPAYQLVYRQFHSTCGSINMVDEIRRVSPNLYLGIGTYGFTHHQRHIPYPFLLKGPHTPYRGDIGRKRDGFQISPREIPRLF